MPGFCDYHKRWFAPDTACDWCMKEYEAITTDSMRNPKTARDFTMLLTAHAACGHLLTDVIATINGEQMTLRDMQDICFALETETL